MPAATLPPPVFPSREGDFTWELIEQFPRQGRWSESEYLHHDFSGLVEFDSGPLKFLPVRSIAHQEVTGAVYRTLFRFVAERDLGKVLFVPVRVRTVNLPDELKHREPDVCFLRRGRFDRQRENFWEVADLVVEVVSPDDPDRDWVTKKREYAAAGIPEYWIADPRDRTLTVFMLPGGGTKYRRAGRYAEGEAAASVLLEGLTVDVAGCFDHA